MDDVIRTTAIGAFAGFLLALIVYWLGAAYVVSDFNPFDWLQEGRFFHAVFCVLGGLWGGAAGYVVGCSDDD